ETASARPCRYGRGQPESQSPTDGITSWRATLRRLQGLCYALSKLIRSSLERISQQMEHHVWPDSPTVHRRPQLSTRYCRCDRLAHHAKEVWRQLYGLLPVSSGKDPFPVYLHGPRQPALPLFWLWCPRRRDSLRAGVRQPELSGNH